MLQNTELLPVISDAKVGFEELSKALGDWKAPSIWFDRAVKERTEWDAYVDKESGPTNQELAFLCSCSWSCLS